MRKLAGAVSVLTVGQGEERTGLTATSVTSLSVEPPTLLICVNRATSSVVPLLKERAFAINVLRPHHEPVADRFAGKGGLKGPARYDGADWTRLSTGAPVLADALADRGKPLCRHCAGRGVGHPEKGRLPAEINVGHGAPHGLVRQFTGGEMPIGVRQRVPGATNAPDQIVKAAGLD